MGVCGCACWLGDCTEGVQACLIPDRGNVVGGRGVTHARPSCVTTPAIWVCVFVYVCVCVFPMKEKALWIFARN